MILLSKFFITLTFFFLAHDQRNRLKLILKIDSANFLPNYYFSYFYRFDSYVFNLGCGLYYVL